MGGDYIRRNFLDYNNLGGNFPDGSYLGGNFPGEIVRVGVILGRNCPGGSYPGWDFSLVGVFRVGIVREKHPGVGGGEFSGGSFPSTVKFNQ